MMEVTLHIMFIAEIYEKKEQLIKFCIHLYIKYTFCIDKSYVKILWCASLQVNTIWV